MVTKPILSNFLLSHWVRSTFLGWVLGFVFILIFASIFHWFGLTEFQFFIGIGMGIGLGYMQNRELKKTMNWDWT